MENQVMSSLVQGTVEAISQKGKATNIKVNGQWYGCGFNGVPCGQGDNVSFPVVQNGRFLNADVNNMQVVQGGGGAQEQRGTYGGQNSGGQPARTGGNAAGNSGGSKGSSYGARKLDDPVQRSIVQQSARNAAIQAVQVASSLDAVPLPTKKAEKFDAVLDLIDQVTERYYNETFKVAEAGGYTERAEKVQFDPTANGQPDADYDDDIPF
jgi:hypothetical protein